MGRLGRLARTSIGSKSIVAVTGILLFLFLIAHMSGNMLIWQGPDAINGYARWLRDHTSLLWTARIGLLAIAVIHVTFTILLTLQNRAARPERYARETTVQAGWSSLNMIWTGLLVLAFILYHIGHFTLHAVDTGAMAVDPATGMVDVYAMVTTGFRVPWVAGSYLAAMVLLGFHLVHGVKSLFQTLGWNHGTINPVVRVVTPLLAVLIAAGNCAIVLSILLGMVD